jgi:hypothetical protein
MSEKKTYVGTIRDEETLGVVITSNPKELSGKIYEITSDSGEGSFFDVLQKIKKELQNEDKESTE